MIYRVRHRTTYDYEDPVSVSHHLVRLTPRNLPGQVCHKTQISVLPAPHITATHNDYFGNTQTFFTLEEPHDGLIVEANSELEVTQYRTAGFLGVSRHGSVSLSHWPATIVRRVWTRTSLFSVPSVSQQAGNSPTTRATPFPQTVRYSRRFSISCKEYTGFHASMRRRPRSPRRSRHSSKSAAGFARTSRISRLHAYGRWASRPVTSVAICALCRRPARTHLVGADASHAWCSVWCPGAGWVDFDPTNNCIPTDGHITVAWGRDYSDVSPIHGVLLGGARHTLDVGVDVIPI